MFFTSTKQNVKVWLVMSSLLLMSSCLLLWPVVGSLAWSFIMFDVNSVFPLSFSMFTLNMMFYVSVCLIALSVFMWGIFYMSGNKMPVFFFVLLTLFVVSMLLLILSESYLVIFLGWEGLGITSFLLIVFYQNWVSLSGGLMTLLTNRLGDSVLLISFSYWLSLSLLSPIYQKGTILAFLLFLLVTLTKSAQVPFTSWLPAAMAAPTPVSALVHSSTLVTAGIWLLVRFSQMSVQLSWVLLMLGSVTLLLASMAALMEVDGKKVVALSTLSQLGLMFMALSLGNSLICLFHLLMHAFAKANLFLMVGNFLHMRFSQQDYRQLSSGVEGGTIFMIMFVSVLSLSGMVFSSGFFSKDSILLSEFSLMGSFLSWMILVSIISLTFAYCLKLIFSLALMEGFHLLVHKTYNPMILYPSMILVVFSMYLGYSMFNNMEYLMIFSQSTSGLYWSYLVVAIIALAVSFKILPSFWGMWFTLQVKLVKTSIFKLNSNFKDLSQLFSSTFLESNFLLYSLSYSNALYGQIIRMGYILTWISIVLLLL